VRAVDDHTFVAGGDDGAVHILTHKEPSRPARA
jgi:hypothetical protein